MSRYIYLASPLGFSIENASYLRRIKRCLKECGLVVRDPWDVNWRKELRAVEKEKVIEHRNAKVAELGRNIGYKNVDLIDSCDFVLGVCDGPQVDDGTASEMGFAAGKGRVVYGLRTDFRQVGDLPGLPINLQVLHFIDSTGGKLFRKIADIRFPGAR